MPAPFNHPRQLTADDFRGAVRQLLPPGSVISDSPDSNIQKIVTAIAEECEHCSQAAADAMDEANPATSKPNAMRGEWAKAASTTPDNLVAVLTEEPVVTIADLRHRFPNYHITEVPQARIGTFRIGDYLTVNAVKVEFAAVPEYFRIGDPIGSLLKRTPNADEVRANVRRYLPAHILLVIAIADFRLLTCGGRPLTCGGKLLTLPAAQ